MRCTTSSISASTAIISTARPNSPAKQVVDELIAKGIAQDERPDGPVIVKIDEQLGLEERKIPRAGGAALG